MSRPEYLTGAGLSFEGGSLNLDFRKRRGHFAFTDDHLEPVREYEEDGVWDGFLVKLPNSELEAIRDFLNKWLPPAESGAGVCQGSEADTAQGNPVVADPLGTSRHVDGAGWQTIDSAPRDGTPILAFCVHPNARYAGEDFAEWTEIVTTRWIDFNGGGWTWNGICGVHTHWRPLPEPPAALAQPSPLDTSGRVEGGDRR